MNEKIGMYTEDEILEHLTEGEGRGFLGRSMYDAIFDKIHTLKTENKQLKQENEQLKEVIKEVREYIEKYRYITDKVTDEDSLYYGQDITMYAFNDDNVMELLQILDKVKD